MGKTEKTPGFSEEKGHLTLTGIDDLPQRAVLAKPWPCAFRFRYTTGPFLLPEGAASLDWIILNNDVTVQRVRVIVFRCSVAASKTPEPPGPIEVTLDPGETSHNANSYPVGFAYEVQVECNSQLVFPYVSVWPGNFGEIIPGTGINSASFIRVLP
jgi:hypothetical protein